MEDLYKIEEILRRELKEYGQKGKLSAGDLEMVHKLTDTIKNIEKISMIEESGYSEDGYSQNGYSQNGHSRDGYSQDGNWRANMEGSYGHGSSYARRGRHWVRGHYSRDGYSQGKSDMISMLEDMMRNANSQEDKQALRQCIDNMRG